MVLLKLEATDRHHSKIKSMHIQILFNTGSIMHLDENSHVRAYTAKI